MTMIDEFENLKGIKELINKNDIKIEKKESSEKSVQIFRLSGVRTH